MKNKQKLNSLLKKMMAVGAIIALLSTLVIAFSIPTGQAALDLNLNAGGLEDALCEDLGEGGVISCGEDTASSFTNFEGSFTPPESEGYAEGITQTDSAREFIVNVTNFVLSFLGLAAVVVIIYGGFLYVTAAGEQERADKGKKSVMYAVIGIIIVLISFALVNTIITGAAGGSDNTSSGLYNSPATGQSLTELQSAQMAKHVQELTQEFVGEYTKYANVVTIVDAMLNVDSFDRKGLEEFKDGYELILKEADPFSATADEAKAALRRIDPYLSASLGERVKNLASNSEWLQTGLLSVGQGSFGKNARTRVVLAAQEDDETAAGGGICANACSPFSPIPPAFVACMADCTASNPAGQISDAADQAAEDAYTFSIEQAQQAIDPNGISKIIIEEDVVGISEAAYTDFTSNMSEIVGDFEDMTESFREQTTLLALLEGDNGIVGRLDAYTSESGFNTEPDTKEYLPGVPGYTTTRKSLPSGGSREVGNTVQKMNELYNLVKNLKFTTAVLSANTKQGNAPLTVTFNGLDSYDPTEITISPEQYTWDLLGDGFGAVSAYDADAPGLNALSQDNKTGPNVTYTYLTPGTYRVGLRVTSSDPANIAAGISYLSIKVNPPSSIIDLSVTGALSAVEQKATDKTTLSFTGEDAKAGITFDASATTDGDGNTDTIVNFKFDFGDGENQNSENPVATHYYNEEGNYRFELEVTDQNGVKDRKRLHIIVASPAAHLEASHTRADIDETVTFDASASLTDFGAINNFAWQITRGAETIFEDASGEPELEYAFNQPGLYTVSVEVTDSSGQSNATSLQIQISSSEPVPAFTYIMKDPARPNIFYFDATGSYDPDEGDILTYEWNIDGGVSEGINFLEGTNATSAKPIIEFLAAGDHDVELKVSDQYEGELKQEGKLSKKVTVASVLGIGVRNIGNAALFLNEKGVASVELELSTNTGVAFEVDWGDGTEKETLGGASSFATGNAVFRVWGNAMHDYTGAGTFPVKVTVLDESDNQNSLTRNVYVGNGQEPIPVIKVLVDNLEAPDPNHVIANRTNTIKFDAGGSLDLNGQSINQTGAYSWVLGDGTRATGKTLTKKYTEIGEFEVTLTVRSTADSSVASSTTIQVSIVDTPPRILGLVVQPQDEELITPLVVKATVNAADDDGEITRYKFWYYDVDNSSVTLGEQISLSAQTFLTINTSGTTGEINTYAFAVEVTDNENNTVSSLDEIPDAQIPTLEVENGPNKAPEADFTVDRTNVMVGETVTFTSDSSDEDGDIVEYVWDVEGDGFFNNPTVTDSTFLHEYMATAPEGIEVRLKVTDDTGATDVSDPVRIFVDSLTQDPTAAFRYTADVLNVTFFNNSTADIANNASLVGFAWDFDTSTDTDGDGDAANDVDSTEESPKFTYETFGSRTVQLTITDNEGNKDSVTNRVELVEIAPPMAGFRFTVVDGLNVKFDNASKPGSAEAPLKSSKWDFEDDGITDSEETSPRHLYEDYGTYTVRLVVIDELGRSDDYKKRIKLEESKVLDLEAFMTTRPEGDPRRNGDIYLPGTQGSVTFIFRAENVVGDVTFCIDKNVFFDTNGNGKKDDDCDHKTNQAGNWTTDFSKDWGMIVVKLTAVDDRNVKYVVTKQIFFEEPQPAPGTASLLPVSTAEALYIVLTALGFAILAAKYYTRKEPASEKKSPENFPKN